MVFVLNTATHFNLLCSINRISMLLNLLRIFHFSFFHSPSFSIASPFISLSINILLLFLSFCLFSCDSVTLCYTLSYLSICHKHPLLVPYRSEHLLFSLPMPSTIFLFHLFVRYCLLYISLQRITALYNSFKLFTATYSNLLYLTFILFLFLALLVHLLTSLFYFALGLESILLFSVLYSLQILLALFITRYRCDE